MGVYALLVLLLCTGIAQGTKGREFVVAFFEHFRTEYYPEIFFIISSDVDTTVHIESVGFNISEDVFVKSKVEYKYTTNEDNFYHGNLDVNDQAFYITSTDDITLYCYNYMLNRGDGYIALPVSSLSLHYLTVSHIDDDTSDISVSLLYTGTTHTVFLIIATEDQTSVTIKVKVKGDNMAGGCANGMLLDGQIGTFDLNKHQIIGAYCDDDITGTEITSDKPVAVLSGHNYKAFPGGSPDHLIDMMMPVESFGRSFFLPESPVKGNKAMYRVVGSETGTKVRTPNGLTFSVDKGEPHDIDVNSTTGPMYIEADRPVLVVQFMKGTASMALVPPVSLYSNSYDVSRPLLHAGSYELKNVFVTVVAPINDVLGLRPYIFPQFEVIKGTCFAFATVALNVGLYQLSHVDSAQFGVVIYIEAYFGGVFTHSAGYNMTDYIAKTDCPVSNECSNGTPFPCSCQEGYFVYQCQDTSQGCNDTPCQYNSTCSDHSTFYGCDCVNGSAGAHCEIDTYDHCSENFCINGTCVDEIDSYSCNCTTGFEGDFCDIDIDECAIKPCVHGNCEDNVNNYTCTCDPGYMDRDCDREINECESNPCQNGGKCNDFLLYYNCTCQPGFEGYDCEINIDPCDSDPCENNGTCTQTPDGFNCSCSPGTRGPNCEIDIDECSSSPCGNGGECVNLNNAFSCNCVEGFTGSVCESYIDPCDSDPCGNNGTCTQTPDGFNCSCSHGTGGPNCEIDIDECSSSPCGNGGECVNQNNAFSCNCVEGFTGSVCESYIDPCDSDPCGNNGTCTQTPDGFNCSCSPGTGGPNCEIDIDECSSSPCGNGGECVNQNNAFSCNCVEGFTGSVCESYIDPCDSDPCGNNGTCTQTPDGFNCSCSPGTGGPNCEIDIDECSSSPCGNGGECVNQNNAFSCNCVEGFTGSVCESYTNPCDSSPCQNNGTCTQTVDGFSCSCPSGIEGHSCEIDIDDCASSPCYNGGTCVDNINSFECLCHTDYGGVLCEFIRNCGCKCKNFNLTDEELAAKLQWLRSLLQLDHSTLSKSVRKKISVPDNRPLSMGIGYSGILFLTLSMGLIVAFDLTTLRRLGIFTPKQREECKLDQFSDDNVKRPVSQSDLTVTMS